MNASESSWTGGSPAKLQARISSALLLQPPPPIQAQPLGNASAVLFLLSWPAANGRLRGGPHLVLTKRSMYVRQPGDLCCPGGGISERLDRRMARLLALPLSPMAAWNRRQKATTGLRRLRLLLAAGLREGFEEIRLNPLGVRFLGPLPPEKLVMFHRTIYPLVLWTTRLQRFHPNSEVERMVVIPLADLFMKERYGRFRLSVPGLPEGELDDFPCFSHRERGRSELLWGATYRITMTFLQAIFGFRPPPFLSRPLVQQSISDRYFSGALLEKKQ